MRPPCSPSLVIQTSTSAVGSTSSRAISVLPFCRVASPSRVVSLRLGEPLGAYLISTTVPGDVDSIHAFFSWVDGMETSRPTPFLSAGNCWK